MSETDCDRRSLPPARRSAPRWGTALALCLLLLLPPGPALAAGFFDAFKDPVDGQFDTSNWLLNRRGFLPVPIIITEPAIGYGGGLALLFFHKSKQDKEKEANDEPLGLPPSVSAVLGAGTENGSWMAGGGGFRYLLARKLGMQVGIDVARGPEDTAFYIVVGSPW